MTGLSDRPTVVVGASRGLGRGIARALGEAGAPVVALARSGAALAELAATSANIQIEVADAADPTVAWSIIDRYEPETLILVAGANPVMRPLHHHTWETFSANWQTDVKIAFTWLREALLKPLPAGSRVVVVSSGAAISGSPASGGYAGAKATQRFVAQYAQEESRRAGLDISVTTVLPRMTPLGDVGRRAARIYAGRAGLTEAAYVARLGDLLTPEIAGSALLGFLAQSPAPSRRSTCSRQPGCRKSNQSQADPQSFKPSLFNRPSEVYMSQANSSDPSWSGGTWLSLISLSLGSFALVTSEFLPASLLTPIARDIGVSEGGAGQAVTATAICAGLAAPLLALLIGRIDRKLVLLALCVLVIASNVTVALAMDYWVLLGARMILGIAMGGFFALAAVTVVHLVSIRGIGKGMSIVLLGISLATISAPPLAALIGDAFGWRVAFLAGAGAGLVALLAQLLALPSVPATTVTNLSTLFGLLRRPKVRVGLVASLLIVGGHFTAFTFIRPYLEASGGLDATALAGVLLGYGLANLVGNVVGGIAADRALGIGFFTTCLLLGIATLGLVNLAASYVPAIAFGVLWGLAFGMRRR